MNSETLWVVILSLGIGSFLLRFSFLGFVGNRPMPQWLLRHLRYTAVAILPALVAPLVAWSNGPGSQADPGQILAAFATLIAGRASMNVFVAILAGSVTLAFWILVMA